MSKRALFAVIIGALLVGVVLSPVIISARATPASYLPNVSHGQWGKYKVLYDNCTGDATTCQTFSPGSLADSDYGLVQVEAVSGTSVTLSLISVYKNGTSSHEGLLVDVASGSINASGVRGTSADYFVLATGLSHPDPIWTSPNAPTLNDTRTVDVLGQPRVVNYLNYSFSYSNPPYGSYSFISGYAFDQSSGLFIEISFSYTTTGSAGNNMVEFAIGMVDNNIWQTSHLPDYTLNANPTSIPISGTETGTATITPMRSYGFSAKISLTATPSASSITCSLSSSSLSLPSSDSSTLSCSGSPGSYTVAIMGNGSYVIRTVTVTVNIASGMNPDFMISSSGGINFQTGASGKATITIAAQNGYSSATNLEVSSTPSGLTCVLSDNSVSGYGSVTMTCSGQPGSYTVTVKATGGGTSHSTQTAVTVSAAPAAPQPASGLSPLVYGGIGVAAVVAALVAFLFLRRKPGAAVVAPGDVSTPATPA